MPITLSRKERHLPIKDFPRSNVQLAQSTNLTIVVSWAANMQGCQGLSRQQTISLDYADSAQEKETLTSPYIRTALVDHSSAPRCVYLVAHMRAHQGSCCFYRRKPVVIC